MSFNQAQNNIVPFTRNLPEPNPIEGLFVELGEAIDNFLEELLNDDTVVLLEDDSVSEDIYAHELTDEELTYWANHYFPTPKVLYEPTLQEKMAALREKREQNIKNAYVAIEAAEQALDSLGHKLDAAAKQSAELQADINEQLAKNAELLKSLNLD